MYFKLKTDYINLRSRFSKSLGCIDFLHEFAMQIQCLSGPNMRSHDST